MFKKLGKIFSGKYKLLAILLVVILLFLSCYLFDYVRMKSFHIEVYSISPSEPIADVKQPVTVVLKLTRHGKPIEGHSLFALAKNGGQFRGNRAVTDKDGLCTLTYVPYTETRLMPAKPILISVVDESNSLLIEVDASYEFYIDLKSKST